VGTIPVGENAEQVKQTNEIKVAVPLLDCIEIENKDITADAMHTQWRFARYLVEARKAHYHFIVKGNQPTLFNNIFFIFKIVPLIRKLSILHPVSTDVLRPVGFGGHRR